MTDPAAELPRGAVIARVRLVAVDLTEDIRDRLSADERASGSWGRRQPRLGADRRGAPGDPVPSAVMLGLWEWKQP